MVTVSSCQLSNRTAYQVSSIVVRCCPKLIYSKVSTAVIVSPLSSVLMIRIEECLDVSFSIRNPMNDFCIENLIDQIWFDA